jgi:hypothetical protein
MARQHSEIEQMRNRFYDEDPDTEDTRRAAILIALNWVLNPRLSDSDITDYLPNRASRQAREWKPAVAGPRSQHRAWR